MRKRKQQPKKLIGVRIDPSLNRAIDNECRRQGIMKMDFCALAFRKLLEATNA